MPAEVEISQKGPMCWELNVKLYPKHNDPHTHEFRAFLAQNNLRVDKDYGWSARRFHEYTILAGSYKRAIEAKKLIEEWGEKNLPK